MSLARSGSRRLRRSRALTSAPLPALTESIWATTLPRRTIVKRSPRCSTASRMSEKFLAASVALTSGAESDYQMKAMRPCPRARRQRAVQAEGVTQRDSIAALQCTSVPFGARTTSRPSWSFSRTSTSERVQLLRSHRRSRGFKSHHLHPLIGFIAPRCIGTPGWPGISRITRRVIHRVIGGISRWVIKVALCSATHEGDPPRPIRCQFVPRQPVRGLEPAAALPQPWRLPYSCEGSMTPASLAWRASQLGSMTAASLAWRASWGVRRRRPASPAFGALRLTPQGLGSNPRGRTKPQVRGSVRTKRTPENGLGEPNGEPPVPQWLPFSRNLIPRRPAGQGCWPQLRLKRRCPLLPTISACGQCWWLSRHNAGASAGPVALTSGSVASPGYARVPTGRFPSGRDTSMSRRDGERRSSSLRWRHEPLGPRAGAWTGLSLRAHPRQHSREAGQPRWVQAKRRSPRARDCRGSP